MQHRVLPLCEPAQGMFLGQLKIPGQAIPFERRVVRVFDGRLIVQQLQDLLRDGFPDVYKRQGCSQAALAFLLTTLYHR